MISQAFIDESGGDDCTSFVLGGYIASVEQWKAFSEDWQAELDAEPSWPALHTAPCNFGKVRPWCDFTTDVRQAKQLKLVDVIAKHHPHAFLVVNNVDAFKRLDGDVAEAFGDGRLYVNAAEALIASLLRFHEAKGVNFGVVDFIFDFQQQFKNTVRRNIETLLIPSMRVERPDMAMRRGSIHWPRPEERERYVPLQAADFLVWHWRRGRDTATGRYMPVYQALMRASDPLFLKYGDGTDLGRIFSASILGPKQD